MKNLVRLFFQITRHTDGEITDFLQRKAEEGFSLVKVVFNSFYFERKEYDKRKVCALTLYSKPSSEYSTELQIRENLPLIREQGWDCICVGKVESLNDSRRHVYLKEEISGAEIPVPDQRSEKRAELRGKGKAFSNLLLCFLYISAVVFLFSGNLITVVTNNFYLVFSVVMTLLICICSFLCVKAFILRFMKRGKPEILDVSTIITTGMLIIFALFLLFDVWFSDKGQSQRIKIGSSSYKIYSDEIPIRLEDLNADVSGKYRTTRRTESSSVIASYVNCFDENFGIKQGETVYDRSESGTVSYIKYTLFSSEIQWLRVLVENQLLPETSVEDSALASENGCDRVYKSSEKSYLLCKGDSILLVKSGFNLSNDEIRKLAGILEM